MSSLRARLAVLPRGAAANGQPRWLRRQSCCTKTCWTIQSAAERRGLPRAIRRDAALRQGAAAGCRSLSGSMPFGLPRHVLFSGRSLRSARMLANAAGLRRRKLRPAALSRESVLGTKPAERPCRPMRASAAGGFGPPHLRAIMFRTQLAKHTQRAASVR